MVDCNAPRAGSEPPETERADLTRRSTRSCSAIERRRYDAPGGRSRGLTWILVVVGVVAFCFVDSAWACPNCKDNLTSDSAEVYAASIMFMMSMPFVIFGGWIWTIVRLRRVHRMDR